MYTGETTHDRQEQTLQDTGKDCYNIDLRKMNRLSVLKESISTILLPSTNILVHISRDTVFNYYDNIFRSSLEGSA